jgi:DnaK suppressor protein
MAKDKGKSAGKSKSKEKKPEKPAAKAAVAKPAKKPAAVKVKPEAKAASKAAKPVKAPKPAKVAKAVAAKAPAKAGKDKAAEKAPLKGAKVESKAIEVKKPVEAPAIDKNKPKGITVVEKDKPGKRSKPQPKKSLDLPPLGPPMLLGGKKWKPLIQSGPNAPKAQQAGIDIASLKGKTPFSKKELEHYRSILVRKRAELVGDVENMEGQALKDSSGSLSNVPQHAAEGGSDAYDQSLSLDIAEVDRKLIREIDDALRRIEDNSFGLCEQTGKHISKDRLEELPWARLSIEAAREREKRTFYLPRSYTSMSGSSSSDA